MPESVQIIIGIVILVGVFILTRIGIAWKMNRAAGSVLRDLELQGAVDPVTAVDLPYSRLNVLRIGMRDYHKKALEYLVSEGVVGKTEGGKFFLLIKPSAFRRDAGDSKG